MGKRIDDSHMKIRDNKLICLNCGGVFDLQFPQPVELAAGVMKLFHKVHLKCQKQNAEHNEAKAGS